MTTGSAAGTPIGPSSNPGGYPYGSYPAYWWSTSTGPAYTDEVAVACPDCGMDYRKRAASAADAERACDVWLSGHRAAKHQEPSGE